MVEHLKEIIHTNILKINIPMHYIVKTLKEGNGIWPQPTQPLRGNILMPKENNLHMSFSQLIINK